MRYALALLLTAAVVPGAWAASTPHVRLSAIGSSATVVGTGFHAREPVTVTVTSGTVRIRKIVRSTLRGAVVARFRSLPTGGCDQVAIKAVGARGDRAAWKSPPRSCGTILQP